MKCRHVASLMLAGLVLLIGAKAAASTVTATFVNVTPSSTVQVTIDGGANYEWTLAGRMQWSRTGGDYSGLQIPTFSSYCVDIVQDVSYGTSYTYNVTSVYQVPDPAGPDVGLDGMGLSKGSQLRELWGRHAADVNDSVSAGAFQVAMWEIVNDPDNQLNAGNFRIAGLDSPLALLAQGWLNQIDGTGPLANLAGLSNSWAQDQVFEAPQEQPLGQAVIAESIPTPAAAWGGALLLGGMVARRVKKKIGKFEI